MIPAGTYKATVLSHAISETKKGDPQAAISFSIESDGPQTITWYGYFTEKTTPHTIKALLACGLEGNNPAGPLKIGKEVSIVIEHETDEETNKLRAKVRWVNNLGGIKNVIPQDMAMAKLSSLEGAVMMARQKLNIKSDDDIPF